MRTILLLSFLLFQITAHAGGMTSVGTIKELAIGSTLLRVEFSERFNDISNPDNCPDEWNYVFDLSQNSQHTKRVYAALLAAKLENKKLKFWLSGCLLTPWGGTSIPAISEIIFVDE